MKELISIIYETLLQLHGTLQEANKNVIAPQGVDLCQNHRAVVCLVSVETRDFEISR